MPLAPLENKNPTCPLCGSSDSQQRHQEFRFSNEESHVYQCGICDTAFLFPQPSNQWLAHEYSGYYRRRSSGVQKIENFKRFFKRHNPRGFAKVLELGGGEGACARALLATAPQTDLTVVESHSDAAKFYADISCRLISSSLEDWLRTNGEKFELIMMFDVLEHLREPASVLKKLRECLEPGGEIWMTVPSYDSVSRRALGGFWPQYKPEHLFYFSGKGLRSLFERLELGAFKITRHHKYLPISYLMNVGAGFGPRSLQILFGTLKKLLPAFLQNRSVSFCLGERLVMAKKR